MRGKPFLKKRIFPSNSPFQKTLVRIKQATNGSDYNTSRAVARIGSGASPPFFEKKVLPLKLPFPKNFSKGRRKSMNDIRLIANCSLQIANYLQNPARTKSTWSQLLPSPASDTSNRICLTRESI